MSLHLVLLSAFALESPESCNDAGPACFGCPAYERCDHHYEGEEGELAD